MMLGAGVGAVAGPALLLAISIVYGFLVYLAILFTLLFGIFGVELALADMMPALSSIFSEYGWAAVTGSLLGALYEMGAQIYSAKPGIRLKLGMVSALVAAVLVGGGFLVAHAATTRSTGEVADAANPFVEEAMNRAQKIESPFHRACAILLIANLRAADESNFNYAGFLLNSLDEEERSEIMEDLVVALWRHGAHEDAFELLAAVEDMGHRSRMALFNETIIAWDRKSAEELARDFKGVNEALALAKLTRFPLFEKDQEASMEMVRKGQKLTQELPREYVVRATVYGLCSLAIARNRRGEIQDALEEAEQAYGLIRDSNPADVARSFLELADTLASIGRKDLSERFLWQLAAATRFAGARDSVLEMVGEAFIRQGLYSDALLVVCGTDSEALPNRSSPGISESNLGMRVSVPISALVHACETNQRDEMRKCMETAVREFDGMRDRSDYAESARAMLLASCALFQKDEALRFRDEINRDLDANP
jgi:tetratricopeptide (TPR) repeat protein